MPNRIPVTMVAAGIVLALTAALSACGSSSPGSSSPGSPPAASRSTLASAEPHSPRPPRAAAPDIIAVRLDAAFSPAAIRLGVGQQFLVAVSRTVQASGLGVPGGCVPGATGKTAGGLLSLRCAEGGYLYTAEHPGKAVLPATVRPRCAAGTMCPQWIAEATLVITII